MKKICLISAIFFMLWAPDLSAAGPTDEEIAGMIKNSYTFQNYLKNDPITVNSKNGIVTLTGTVADEYHKNLAKDTAANVEGVKKVEEKLEVSGK
ncbi:MAG TPA: BON domain-containing protein, partial [Candidatus Omnitrophota bacterium]|nr:BON domain-containing protein [Candidatus Omnitrophota bacterium]